tara:strand:+ start:127 stop:954 length:828 start_codon:yes stop_codon:yes gene_type:complete
MEKIIINTNEAKPEFDYSKMLSDSFVDVTEKIQQPPIALSIGTHQYKGKTFNNAFGTYGNFSVVAGASKARKSFFKSLAVASYIGGNSTYYAPDLKTHRATDKYVLDFDTEQSEYHSQRCFKRVTEMVGSNWENYKPFSLRKYTHKERLQFVEWCLMESDFKDNIGLVSIDGLADLVADVNDLTACNNLVQKLLTWTDVSMCHLMGVIHTNFGSSKPTGHLGSSLMKKAESVCMLEHKIDSSSVKFPYTRDYPIDDFEFIINSDGLPETRESGGF